MFSVFFHPTTSQFYLWAKLLYVCDLLRAGVHNDGGLLVSLRAHRALINVWIPSVFLQGRAANAYHVYQVRSPSGRQRPSPHDWRKILTTKQSQAFDVLQKIETIKTSSNVHKGRVTPPLRPFCASSANETSVFGVTCVIYVIHKCFPFFSIQF